LIIRPSFVRGACRHWTAAGATECPPSVQSWCQDGGSYETGRRAWPSVAAHPLHTASARDHCSDRDLRDAHTLVLGALRWSFVLAQDMRAVGQVLAFRDFWPQLLTHPEVSLDGGVLVGAAAEPALAQAGPLAALGEALSATSARSPAAPTARKHHERTPSASRSDGYLRHHPVRASTIFGRSSCRQRTSATKARMKRAITGTITPRTTYASTCAWLSAEQAIRESRQAMPSLGLSAGCR
jgi:hypothetical protein